MNREPVVVTLNTPVDFGSERIEQITLQPPRAKHVKNFKANSGNEEMFTLASMISGRPVAVFEELFLDDWIKIGEAIGSFLDSGLNSGKTS